MRQVQLEQTHESLDELVTEAESGQSLTIFRAGNPVAKIIPFANPAQAAIEPDRLEALQRLTAFMDAGLDLGGTWPGREQLYNAE